jgi:uncharacterized membrane protein YbjE (DUF340 family)
MPVTKYLLKVLMEGALPLVLSLAAGMAVGFILRRRPRVIAGADRLSMWAVFALLFLLGLTTGLDEEIVGNLPKLGIQALVLTIGAVGGSLALGWVLYVWLFRGAEHEE